MATKTINVGVRGAKPVVIGGLEPLVFIGGPCAIESRRRALMMAERIAEICAQLKMPWIYKSCYDKDCRSSPDSFHGVGIDEGLSILREVRSTFGAPVVTDFSDAADAPQIGEVCD